MSGSVRAVFDVAGLFGFDAVELAINPVIEDMYPSPYVYISCIYTVRLSGVITKLSLLSRES